MSFKQNAQKKKLKKTTGKRNMFGKWVIFLNASSLNLMQTIRLQSCRYFIIVLGFLRDSAGYAAAQRIPAWTKT